MHAPLPPASRPGAPALDQVNDRIRSLMQEPASDERTAAYAQFLTEWADVTREDIAPAA